MPRHAVTVRFPDKEAYEIIRDKAQREGIGLSTLMRWLTYSHFKLAQPIPRTPGRKRKETVNGNGD